MHSKKIALIVVFATLYSSITLVFHPISYGEINIRVSDSLYPLIGLFGFPSLIGCVLGHFIANLFSPLGIIDLLSVGLFIPAKLLILKFKFKGVPIHVLSVALWVGFMLHYLYGLPLVMTIIFVGMGESIAELVLGRWVYLEVEKWLKRI